MPEQWFERLKKNILPAWKACFIAALVAGLIAHFYKITNWIPNWDSLVFRYDAQNMLALGRWFLPVVCAPSSFYDLPWITGLLAILYYGLGAVCICKMFGVKNKIVAMLIGAVVTTFPTVTSVMMYNYVADGYALAFFFSCAAVMLLVGEKPRYLAAIVLIALAVGAYQAYITVSIMLLLLWIILELLQKSSDLKKTMLKTLKFLLTGVAGMLLYYLVLTVLLKITNTELIDYQGVNSSVDLKTINLPASLYVIKETFVNYFFDFSSGVSLFLVLNCIVVLLTFALCIAEMVRNKLCAVKILLLCFFIALLPIGACVLAFINSNVDYHNLMKMGFVAFYVLFILLYEKAKLKNKALNTAKAWAVLGVVTVLVLNQISIANVSYHKLHIAYEKSYGTLIRIADRIEQTEGAEGCERVLILGALPGSEDYSVNLPPDMTGTTDSYILRADDEVVGQSVMCSALNDYCGKNYQFLYGDEKAEYLQRTEVKQMSCWPEKSSVAVIENVIVIKLSESEGK